MNKSILFAGSCWAVLLMMGCADLSQTDASSNDTEETGSAEQAWIWGPNPSVDVEYLTSLSTSTSSSYYGDIAVGNTQIYLARSDGRVEVRNGNPPYSFLNYLGQAVQKLDFVPSSSWALIGSDNGARKIYCNLTPVSKRVMGSYPAGVNTVFDIAGIPVTGDPYNQLDVFITTPVTGGGRVLRKGRAARSTNSIVWDATVYASSMFESGLTVAAIGASGNVPALFANYSYQDREFFSWYAPPDLTNTIEPATFSEHAYNHPNGFLDRFTNRIAYAGDYFWSADKWEFDDGSAGWALVRISKFSIRY